MNVLALAHHSAGRVAELGFLLAALAGLVFAFGRPLARQSPSVLGGLLLAVGSVLVIVAFHWGHY